MRGISILNKKKVQGLPRNGLISRLFSAGLNEAGTHFIDLKGDNAPVTRKHCAKGNGTNGYVNYGILSLAELDGTGNFEIELRVVDLGTAGLTRYPICEEYNPTGDKRGWAIIDFAKSAVQINIGKPDGTYKQTIVVAFSSNIANGDLVKLKFGIDPDNHENGKWTSYKNGVENGSAIQAGQNKVYCFGADFHLLRYGGGSNHNNQAISDLKIWNNGTLVFHAPLERNTFDLVSGAQGEISGGVDLEAVYEDEAVYSYNLNNGFDRYQKDGDTKIIDVPYKDGIPIAESVDGYTKISSHPAGQNNMAWFFVDIPELDKSDSVFNATCRASEFYDSNNPTFWHSSELNLDTLQSYLENKNLIFIADTANKYDTPLTKTGDVYDYSSTGKELTKSTDLLIYDTEQVEPALEKIVKYIQRKQG